MARKVLQGEGDISCDSIVYDETEGTRPTGMTEQATRQPDDGTMDGVRQSATARAAPAATQGAVAAADRDDTGGHTQTLPTDVTTRDGRGQGQARQRLD